MGKSFGFDMEEPHNARGIKKGEKVIYILQMPCLHKVGKRVVLVVSAHGGRLALQVR
jgi:hypothetical protein